MCKHIQRKKRHPLIKWYLIWPWIQIIAKMVKGMQLTVQKMFIAIPMYIEFSLYVYSLYHLQYDLSYVANVQF